jgi:chromosome segregation ATPase
LLRQIEDFKKQVAQL